MMSIDFNNIHIGSIIRNKVKQENIDEQRICKFMNCTEDDIELMYNSSHLSTDYLLKWSKLLEYDFFRVYSQHLILYSPPKKVEKSAEHKITNTGIPQFRKNIYTREVIEFILELIATGEKSKNQIIEEYRIPKTTLYKWLVKYKTLA